MLEKMSKEIKMVVGYDIWFLVICAIISNKGIDGYLLDEFIDVITDGETILYMTLITVTYIVAGYLYKTISKAVKHDIEQVKTELEEKKVKE